MGLIYADLEDPRNTEQDKIEIAEVLKRMESNDPLCHRALGKIAVLLTSHPGNRGFLKASIESYKKLGLFLVLAYDNYLDPKRQDITWNDVMPDRDMIDNVDSLILGPHTTFGGVMFPYFWLTYLASGLLRSFDLIFCSNGDTIMETPERFLEIVEMLGDADIIGCGMEQNRIFNTASFLVRTETFIKIMNHFRDHFIPFKVYEKYTKDIGNTEGRFAKAIKDLGVKDVTSEKIENPYNDQLHIKGYGTWYKILKFRHIHAEFGFFFKYPETAIPPELKYLDERHISGSDYAAIKKWWENHEGA